MPKKILSYGLAVLIGVLLIFTGFFYGKNHPPRTESAFHEHTEGEVHNENSVKLTQEQIEKMGLKFQIVGPGNLSLVLSSRGKIILHPDSLAHIIPKVSGVAREANKNIGDFVKVNEVMAVLESRDMAEIKAAYLSALSKQRLAISALEREKRLYQEQVSAQQDYLNAQNIYEEASINVQLTKQKLQAFSLSNEEIQSLTNQNSSDLRFYFIRSPIEGTVIMRHITKGEFVENTTTIYEVADLSTVWVNIGISPQDFYRVKKGQTIEVVNSVENKSSTATLIYVSPIITEETITTTAIAEIDNSQNIWRPGTFVKVNIASEKIPLPLVIKKEAIQKSDGKDFIFVVTPEGFEKRLLTIGRSDNDNIEILTGVIPGEQYVANKTFLLKAELGKHSTEHEH